MSLLCTPSVSQLLLGESKLLQAVFFFIEKKRPAPVLVLRILSWNNIFCSTPSLTLMTVAYLLNIRPDGSLQEAFLFGTFSFLLRSSTPAVSRKILLKHAPLPKLSLFLIILSCYKRKKLLLHRKSVIFILSCHDMFVNSE